MADAGSMVSPVAVADAVADAREPHSARWMMIGPAVAEVPHTDRTSNSPAALAEHLPRKCVAVLITVKWACAPET